MGEAIAAFRQAIALDPKEANAWGVLGVTLRMQGRFVEARDAMRRALELLSANHPLRRVVADQLRNCEQSIFLDGKLHAILRGEASPAAPSEAVALAQMCRQPHRKRYAASARLYADAFIAEPKLAADLNQQHRYNAACSAALAAAGQGQYAHLLPDKVTVMFRSWLCAGCAMT